MMGGAISICLRRSLMAVRTQINRVMGSPQKSADRPRTNFPKARSNSSWGASSSILKCQIRVLAEAAFVFVQEAHAFGRFEAIGFDRFVNLRLHLPLQFVF